MNYCFVLDQYFNGPYVKDGVCAESDTTTTPTEKKAVDKIRAAQSMDEIVEIISDELTANIINQLKG